jgi:hypothetical protein
MDTGPKRQRKGRGKPSAFIDAEEDYEYISGEEPGPSIISAVDGMEPGPNSPSTARNGTLMLTFDSKARVPLDRTQGQRGVTAHASHNLIPRIVTRQIVMSAVDQAFASPSSGGEPYVDPREKAVQALNNVPFSLSNGDPRDEPRPPKGKNVTRAAAKEEQKQNPPPMKNEYDTSLAQTTPAPPWLSSSGAATGESAYDEEGIGSGKDDEDSLNADEEGLTPEDYPRGPEGQPQITSQSENSKGQDVEMTYRPAFPLRTPAFPEQSRPSAQVDFSGLQSLSDAALNENQTRAKISSAESTKTPDGILVIGKELPPRVINGVLVKRRQANYLDDAAFLREVAASKDPPAPRPEPSTVLQPPTFASMWNSAKAAPVKGLPSTSGGSGVPGRSMWGSGAAQSNPLLAPGFQSARQGLIGVSNDAGSTLERPQGSALNRAEPQASGSVRKRPQLAKLAPAATSPSGNLVDAPPGPLAFRLPLSIHTPPTIRRPLTPNAPPSDRPPSSNAMPMSPYAPPPDSRKRKTMPQSPGSNGRLSLDARQQKVRRIELDTERRRRVNKINPMFAVGQEMATTQAPSSSTNPSTSTGYHRLPPPTMQSFRAASSSNTHGVIGFANLASKKVYATPRSGAALPSVGASTSKGPTGPAFGQSGFQFKGVQPSAPNAAGNLGSGNVFASFSSQAGPSFRSKSNTVPGSGTSQASVDSMDLDDDDDLLFGEVRALRTNKQMDMDASGEEDNGGRNAHINRADAEMYRGGPSNNRGVFAQALDRAAASLPISAPVSSSRMDRGLPGSNMVSPTSTSRESPVLAPMAHPVPGTSTRSPLLPSINSLLRQSPAPEPRDSLPPIQNPPAADPASTQPTAHRPTALAHSRTQSVASDIRASSMDPSPQTLSSGQIFYYGFHTARCSDATSSSTPIPTYSGGDENDLGQMNYRQSDWRD